MRHMRGSRGLLGRIVAILLLTLVIEFGASTLLYERASRVLVREDEARRLAEHLVIARKLLAERQWRDRAPMAAQLTTDRYDVHWSAALPLPAPIAPELDQMRQQILAWEPELGRSELTLRLVSPGRHASIAGDLRLPDGSWLIFGTRGTVHGWDLALGRIVLALVPAMALLIVGALLVRRTLHPLRTLAEATGQVGLGREVAVAEAGTLEVRRVIRAFNQMQGRIHRLIADRTQALAAVGHDLRTPLSRLQLRLEAVQDGEVRSAIGSDVAEMDAMIGSLLAFLAGEDDPERAVAIDLAVLAATLVDDASDRGRNATYVGPDHMEAMVRPVGMRRALGNLLENALHYGTSAVLTIERQPDAILLRVEDDGPGIPEERMEDALRPFARLDAARGRNTQGLGLGLAIVARAVDQEGGTLRLANRDEGGLRAEIRLPAGPEASVRSND